ncbi:MAG: glutamate racemase [Anaerolineales bacterium]|nr:glutamate racemase [Anaerolineales bacterium]
MPLPVLGVFDSGLGGLSVLREIRRALPGVPLAYVADQAHVPYGARPLAEVRGFAEGITRYLQAQGAPVVVVACHTASAAALAALRQNPELAGLRVVGMEPAVKPAVEVTRTGVVGVLATPATFQGELYAAVVERFAQGVTVIQQVCPGLVQQIEAGRLDTPDTEAMLRGWVAPLLARGIDALVLGCTHYPFVIPLLQKICGLGVRVIDPAPAVARQAARMWAAVGADRPSAPAAALDYATSGDPTTFAAALPALGLPPGAVRSLRWQGGALIASTIEPPQS